MVPNTRSHCSESQRCLFEEAVGIKAKGAAGEIQDAIELSTFVHP